MEEFFFFDSLPNFTPNLVGLNEICEEPSSNPRYDSPSGVTGKKRLLPMSHAVEEIGDAILEENQREEEEQ